MRLSIAAAALSAALLPGIGLAQVYRSTSDAPIDPVLSPLSGGYLAIPGAMTDFVRAGGGQFVELPDGTARLTCRVFSQSNLYQAFLVDITLTGRVTPADPAYPPSGAPDRGLFPSAYTELGGPVDASTFVYYTGATGTLNGVRNLTGSKATLTAAGPVQIGAGANNHNDHFGLFGEFQINVLSQAPWNPVVPTGNAMLSLDFVSAYDEATSHPQIYEGITTLPAARGLSLPGVADDYVFIPTGAFREANDGTAVVNGTLARADDLDDSWGFSLTLGGRVDPGQPAWPPAGSPVLQLLPSAYAANGGEIDPAHWHYYTTAVGTLTGTGRNAGGSIDLAPTVAVQVGGGANQLNSYFGFYGAFQPTIVTQPTGRVLAITGDAELHGLTASFPVVPFPSLTVPATVPQHPVLSEQGLLLHGDNLAWVDLIGIDGALLSRGSGASFLSGWFEVIDNTNVRVHLGPTTSLGLHSITGYNAATATNTIQIDLVVPTAPVLVAESTVGDQGTIHLRIHHGAVTGPVLSLVGLSNSLAPSSYPGLVDLEIGAGFTDFLLDPNVYSHDPATGIAAIDYGPLPSALLGLTYHFEGIILDLGAQTVPFPTTNAWSVAIQ